MSTHEHITNHVDFQSLIPFAKHTIDDDVKNTVDARHLHATLEVGKDFTTWVRV